MSFLDLFVPRRCFLCWAKTLRTSHLCADCEHELPILPQVCLKCAIPIKPTRTLCRQCVKRPPAFDAVRACFIYQDPIARWIAAFKFTAQFNYSHVFYALLLEKVKPHPRPDVVIPMPLHPKRLKERGFNQSILIARPLCRALGLPLMREGAKRIIHTAPQRSLNALARARNVEHAFTTTIDFTNKHIAILDDVMTTGQTTQALASTLKKAGARQVDVWCIARVMR